MFLRCFAQLFIIILLTISMKSTLDSFPCYNATFAPYYHNDSYCVSTGTGRYTTDLVLKLDYSAPIHLRFGICFHAYREQRESVVLSGRYTLQCVQTILQRKQKKTIVKNGISF